MRVTSLPRITHRADGTDGSGGGTTLEDVFLWSPPNPDRQLPNRLPETPETLRPDKTDESMTTEGSRTDDASETSAAHCPGRTPPSLADDEGEHNAVVGACVRGHHAASVLDRRGVRGISRRRVRCRKRDRATHRMGPGGVRLRVDISWSDSVDTARTPWRSVPTTSTAC